MLIFAEKFDVMNEFRELLLSRQSCREFSAEPLAAETVQAIVEAGLLAPSSRNGRPWQFFLIDDASMLATLSHCKPSGAKPLESCPLAVAVCADPMQSAAWIEDCSIAAALMQLQAHDLGVASCWVQIRDRACTDDISAEEYVAKYLGIPDHLRVECIIALGFAAHPQPLREKELDWEKVHI